MLMDLDTHLRTKLTNQILQDLRTAAPGSLAMLRGSLATNQADAYSDIDILWQVPDSEFNVCVDNLSEILARVGPLESLRSDPPLQRSTKHRLFFARYQDVPLFWRVDLEIFAESIHHDPNYDLDNPEARGEAYAVTESALMNGVLTCKALLRGKGDVAEIAIQRAYDRVSLDRPPVPIIDQVISVCDAVKVMDPRLGSLAERVKELAVEVQETGLNSPTTTGAQIKQEHS